MLTIYVHTNSVALYMSFIRHMCVLSCVYADYMHELTRLPFCPALQKFKQRAYMLYVFVYVCLFACHLSVLHFVH
jgi:hypothetical protein